MFPAVMGGPEDNVKDVCLNMLCVCMGVERPSPAADHRPISASGRRGDRSFTGDVSHNYLRKNVLYLYLYFISEKNHL